MNGIFKCKNCGATIDLSSAKNGVIECEYCFNKFTVPKNEKSTSALRSLGYGEHYLDMCKFDDAYSAYEKAKSYDPKEPEAYWGMALAEFKVQFIKDTVDNCLKPICHEFINKSFKLNANYRKALEYATGEQKKEYIKKAEKIDYIREEFLRLKHSGLDYDSFICVKVSKTGEQTDSFKKNWTEDAYYANEIYDLLKQEGYTPFFSEREIRDRIGADYEAMILYALYTSETMLVVCRNEDYLQTPWVKNEYTRFKELVNNKEKENDSLAIIYHGKPIEKLPNNRGKIQGIDSSRPGAYHEIVKFVETHTPLARAKKEEEKRRKNEETELLRQQLEEQRKIQREIEEKLKNFNPNAATGATSAVVNLLIRANQEMEAKNFGKAKNFLETVLERAPEKGEAWWCLFLCEFECSSEKYILTHLSDANIKTFSNSQNFKNARRYANGSFKDRINEFIKQIKSQVEKNKNDLETEIRKFENELTVGIDDKKQWEAEYGELINDLQTSISEADEKNRINELASLKCQEWRKISSLLLGGLWWISSIIVAIGVFVKRMVDYSNNSGDFFDTIGEIILGILVSVIIGAVSGTGLIILVSIAHTIIRDFHNKKASNLKSIYDESQKELDENKNLLNDAQQKLSFLLGEMNPKISKLEEMLSELKQRKSIMENCINCL